MCLGWVETVEKMTLMMALISFPECQRGRLTVGTSLPDYGALSRWCCEFSNLCGHFLWPIASQESVPYRRHSFATTCALPPWTSNWTSETKSGSMRSFGWLLWVWVSWFSGITELAWRSNFPHYMYIQHFPPKRWYDMRCGVYVVIMAPTPMHGMHDRRII